MEPDPVDLIITQWHEQRPDIDVSGMAIIARISRLARAVQPLLDAVFAKHELESWEFDVLATLLRSGEPHQLTPGALLDSMMITSGAMTNRLDRLEERGFIRRSPDPRDRRRVVVTLTEPAKALVDRALRDHAANEVRLVGGLDERDQDSLVSALRSLHHSIDANSDQS